MKNLNLLSFSRSAFSFALVLLTFQFASAGTLVTSKYQAQADGVIRFNTEEGTALIGNGPLEVTVKRLNPFSSPIQFIKGGRVLVLKNDLDTFNFTIPSHADLVGGQVTVSAEDAAQTADLKVKESRVQTGTKQEVHNTSCTYTGYCNTCATDLEGKMSCGPKLSSSCSGDHDVLYQIDTFQRSLEVLISEGSQSLHIKTQGTPEFKSTALKVLTNCN
jgi:hypothetical protein